MGGLDHIEGAIALEFLVDTGSDASLAIDPANLKGIGVEVTPDAPAISVVGSGAAGDFEARVTFATVDLELGGQQLDAFPVGSLESFPTGQGNIGTIFMQHYVVTLDWPGSTIYLDPLTDDP